tara:strand:+ start:393 stop:1265 length:873 start_codon:yes stop_codon:yes gene_type:complete
MVELSVLIPTYNRADSLDRTLDSLNNQTYEKSFQCIIADNCSSDQTRSVVEKWKSKEKNFEIEYYKHEKELLPIDNWESLINRSETKYSKILFDDDWIKPTFIKEMISLLKLKNVDCVVSNIDIFVEKQNEERMLEEYFKLKEGLLNFNNIIEHFTEEGPRINVSPSASIIVTEKLKEAFFYSLKNTECTKKVIGNDLVINYFYLFNRGNVYYTNRSLAVCGAGDNSITVSTDDRFLFYCYLNTLIGLISSFSIELSKNKKKKINKKILTYKVRKLINPKYKKILSNKLN